MVTVKLSQNMNKKKGKGQRNSRTTRNMLWASTSSPPDAWWAPGTDWYYAPCYFLWGANILVQLLLANVYRRGIGAATTEAEFGAINGWYNSKGELFLLYFLASIAVHVTAGLYLSWSWVVIFLPAFFIFGIALPVIIFVFCNLPFFSGLRLPFGLRFGLGRRRGLLFSSVVR